jgi:hypothetical protein
MQDDVNTASPGCSISITFLPIREHAAMCAVRHPIQLNWGETFEQFDVRKEIAGIVFLKFSHA